MATFDQNIQTIKTAIYGRDVRAAIAEGMEQAKQLGGGGLNVTSVDDVVAMIDYMAEEGYDCNSNGYYFQKKNDTQVTPLRNSIVRGKWLGTMPTEAQLNAIATGKFTDLALGDYWATTEEDSVKYIIKDFDYYNLPGYIRPWQGFRGTDYCFCPDHHVVVGTIESVCANLNYDADGVVINSSGAYTSSDIRLFANGATVANGFLLPGTPVNNLVKVFRYDKPVVGGGTILLKDIFFVQTTGQYIGYDSGVYGLENANSEKKQFSFYKKSSTGVVGKLKNTNKYECWLRSPTTVLHETGSNPSYLLTATMYGKNIKIPSVISTSGLAINYVLCGEDVSMWNDVVAAST